MEIFNRKIDFFFIKFPIIFPLIYLFFLYSFNFPCLTYFRDKSPGTPVGFLVWELDDDWESLIAKVAESDFQAIHPANGIVSRDFVAACKKRNLDVNAWTVNDKDRMEELQIGRASCRERV